MVKKMKMQRKAILSTWRHEFRIPLVEKHKRGGDGLKFQSVVGQIYREAR